MARILAPVSGYNGVSASVEFVDGVGDTDSPYLIGWFRAHGYTVVDDAPQPQSPADSTAQAPVAPEATNSPANGPRKARRSREG